MIQFNLLPDVKLEYLRVRRTKRLVIGASLLATAIAVIVVIVLAGTVEVVQKHHLSSLKSDIHTYTNQLHSKGNLNKILTVQNQLESLPDLHDKKPVAKRLFSYLKILTPKSASISQLQIDFGGAADSGDDSGQTISITGAANSLSDVNVFTDTLKFTKYREKGSSDKSKHAFSKVVLASFSRTESGATYNITADFDPAIFDSSKDIKLTVPNIISTRSSTEQPKDLFKNGPPKEKNNSQ
jgi:Tfp pilus assembly protein PilN